MPARVFSRSAVVPSLAIVAGVLALVAALAGIVLSGGDGPATVTTWRGQEVEIYGTGLYRDSSTFTGAGARGTDLVTLLVGLPLLAAALLLHRRGSLRGGLLLAGALTWLVYVYGGYALGAIAWSDLFLMHVAIFAASLWALVLLLTTADLPAVAARLEPGVPRRGLAAFLIAAGVVTAAIWLIEPIVAAVSGDLPPSLGVSATLFTTGLDTAVIAPATWIAGALVWRGRAAGYLAAAPILVLAAMLAPMIAAQTAFQLDAGVTFTTAELVGPLGGFLVLAGVAIALLARALRDVSDVTGLPRPSGMRQQGHAHAS